MNKYSPPSKSNADLACPSKSRKHRPYFNYEFLPDGWIRLLSIKNATDPSDLDETLNTTLISAPLDACPPYTALSYTWGNSSSIIGPRTVTISKVLRCYPVFCGNEVILGSRNLRDALRRIQQYQTYRSRDEDVFEKYADPDWRTLLQRTYGETEFFWIDALCIDQDDVSERSRQVSLMDTIYAKASHTIVWLGESDVYTTSARSFLLKVAQTVKNEEIAGQHHDSQIQLQETFRQARELEKDEQIAFVALMSRNWFSRMWVLQECILSSQLGILLGSFCFNFQLLLHAANLESENARDHGFIKTAIAAAQTDAILAKSILCEKTFNSIPRLVFMGQCKELIASGRLPDFPSVIATSRMLEAQDPRDKIYAIMGIASEFRSHKSLMPAPDYTKSTKAVYIEATYAVITARKDLAILALISPDAALKGLPSWCPDYTSIRRVLRDVRDLGQGWRIEPHRACQPTFELLHDDFLRVSGTRIDHVVEKSTLCLEPQDSASLVNRSRLDFGIAEICRIAANLDLSRQRVDTYRHQSRIEMLWRTLILDELAGVSPVPDQVGLLFADFIKYLLNSTISYHRKRSETNGAVPLSEVELQAYVERLILFLERLETLEPQNRRLLPRAAHLKTLLLLQQQEQRTYQSENTYVSESSASATGSSDGMETLGPTGCTLESPGRGYSAISADEPSNQTLANDRLQQTFVQAFLPLMKGTMVRLGSETLGLTQADVLPNDEIWLLHGALAPICLRPVSPGHFQCLGEIYVHGIMHGEAASSYGPSVLISLE